MSNEQQKDGWNRAWLVAAVIWALLLSFAPDPRPLATPAWSIELVRSVLHVQDAAARVIAALALRMLFLGVLGMLLMFASRARSFDLRGMVALLASVIIGICTLWINHGYFPISAQLKLAVIATLCGVLLVLVLRRSILSAALLIGLLGWTYWTLTNYDVSEDLDRATRDQVKLLLKNSAQVPDGDAGLIQLTINAFELATARSRSSDPLLQNQAAILALSLVLGDEKLAGLADRAVDKDVIPRCDSLRARITLHERADWSRHFWVSAGLRVLSGSSRTLNVGVIKELKDANAGGSGFSFGDLAADASGERLAEVATSDVASAVAVQERLHSNFKPGDLMPDVRDLPEGIHVDEFEEVYGGAGGALTDSLVETIIERIGSCGALQRQVPPR